MNMIGKSLRVAKSMISTECDMVLKRHDKYLLSLTLLPLKSYQKLSNSKI